MQVHFELDQYENHRLDGVRKLKPNAVPTLFPKCTKAKRCSVKKKTKALNETLNLHDSRGQTVASDIGSQEKNMEYGFPNGTE